MSPTRYQRDQQARIRGAADSIQSNTEHLLERALTAENTGREEGETEELDAAFPRLSGPSGDCTLVSRVRVRECVLERMCSCVSEESAEKTPQKAGDQR